MPQDNILFRDFFNRGGCLRAIFEKALSTLKTSTPHPPPKTPIFGNSGGILRGPAVHTPWFERGFSPGFGALQQRRFFPQKWTPWSEHFFVRSKRTLFGPSGISKLVKIGMSGGTPPGIRISGWGGSIFVIQNSNFSGEVPRLTKVPANF